MIQLVGDNTPDKKRISAEIERGVVKFWSLPVSRIQDECNLRREALLRFLATYKPGDNLSFWGLPNTTVAQARQEITRPFQLVAAPDPIIIDLQRDTNPQVPNAAAYISLDPALRGIIFVLSNNIDPVALCARDTKQPLLDVAFHEMLHLSGDAVPSEDGILRHQYSGTEVIRQFLGLPP